MSTLIICAVGLWLSINFYFGLVLVRDALAVTRQRRHRVF
ncbi:hypothetical protein FHT78_005459 [Rhizobium sp. BK196]|nr:hypothetical protein [Rhizobium sp. BK196]